MIHNTVLITTHKVLQMINNTGVVYYGCTLFPNIASIFSHFNYLYPHYPENPLLRIFQKSSLKIKSLLKKCFFLNLLIQDPDEEFCYCVGDFKRGDSK